ncbi:MAG: zinc-ribbon domain-containing protein [Thermodesulfobacteriota bacterium]|nr:zinc-ribbon domain-containing protein [Thermodesulfobacteriota bacterium]
MIIECPNCQSKFKVDDSILTRKKIRMRCSICSHVFTFDRLKNMPLEEEIEEVLETQKDVLQEQIEGPAQEDKEKASDEEAIQIQPESVIKEIDSILGSDEQLGIDQVDTQLSSKAKKKGRKISLLVVLIILIIIGILAWFMRERLFELYSPPEDTTQGMLERGPFFNIPESSVTYEILNNYKEGTVLVIKGMVKRLTKRPVDYILVQARVYDRNKNLIASRDVYAGIIPNSSEFTRQGSSEINALLDSRPADIEMSPLPVDIPFAAAFFGDAALRSKSFQVEVKEFHWQ